jgi:hypothetical protein
MKIIGTAGQLFVGWLAHLELDINRCHFFIT